MKLREELIKVKYIDNEEKIFEFISEQKLKELDCMYTELAHACSPIKINTDNVEEQVSKIEKSKQFISLVNNIEKVSPQEFINELESRYINKRKDYIEICKEVSKLFVNKEDNIQGYFVNSEVFSFISELENQLPCGFPYITISVKNGELERIFTKDSAEYIKGRWYNEQ